MRLVRLAAATSGGAVLAASLVALACSPAQADSVSGGTSGDGVGVAVSVSVSSPSGDSSLAGSVSSVSVPPVCWWGPIDLIEDVDTSDSEAMRDYFDETRNQMRGHAAGGYFAIPQPGYVNRIIQASKNEPYQWYRLYSRDGVNCAEEGGFADSFGTPGDAYGPNAGDNPNEPIAVSYAAFPAAQGPPPPIVDVEDVVTEVWDAASQQIEGPDLDRNPKAAADGVTGATLVNMETWFWVQNEQAALADDGLIELEVSVPGTPVQATLTSSTDGVQVSSPAGAADCSIDQATTAYAAGVAESSACAFPFSRANTGGWDVTATTTWTGSWTGTQANGDQVGGDLDTLTPSATSNVPVAESQAIVDEVG